MAYSPISGAPPQYSNENNELASGYYLKLYEANTTTPLSMATDSTGATLLAKCKLNPDGFPISNPLDNETVFVPYVDQSYRYVIYPTEADADANNTAAAFINVAEVPMMPAAMVSDGRIPYVYTSRDKVSNGGTAISLQAADLSVGDYAMVAGFDASADGGFDLYEIVASGGDVTMDNGNEAKLVSFYQRKKREVIDVTGSSNITLTDSQASADELEFSGATSGNINVSTPSNAYGRWFIINNDTGGNTVTFATNTGTGVAFSQQGEERQVRSDGTNMVNICRHALGETVAVPSGGIIPPIENYVVLSDSTDDTANYNSGKVDNEQTTSSGATVVISFDIADTSSPFDNETWNCWNSEVRNPSAGATPGTLSNDEGQQITGTWAPGNVTGYTSVAIGTGAFSRINGGAYANILSAQAGSGGDLQFDSADSTDSRQDSDRFHYKREVVTYYRRFK